MEGYPSHLKRCRVSAFNIIHCPWIKISELSLLFFFHVNLQGDHILSSMTKSRLVNSFDSQICPNSFCFSFSEYPVVLTFFILLAWTLLCVHSFSRTLDYRCIDFLKFDSPNGHISKEDRVTPLLANSRAASAQAVNHIFCRYTYSHHHYLRQEERGSSFPALLLWGMSDILPEYHGDRYHGNKKTKLRVGGTTYRQSDFRKILPSKVFGPLCCRRIYLLVHIQPGAWDPSACLGLSCLP